MKKFYIVMTIAVIFLASSAFVVYDRFGHSFGGSLRAEVYVEGELYETIPLTEDKQVKIQTQYGYNILEIKNGGIRVAESDCTTQTCVHTSWQTSSSGMIVCLPHKMVVKITGNTSEDNVDAVSQ